jgi:hypothetical protein
MLVRFHAKELASLDKKTRTRDATTFAAPATREAAGLKIADVGQKTELGALMNVLHIRRNTRTIPQRIRELYPTAIPNLVTVTGSKLVRDLAGEEPVATRRAAAETYDKLATALADVRRLAAGRGPGSAMSLVVEGDELNVYERTSGPLHPASVRARFEKA